MQHILDFAIIAGLKNYWQITENTFNDEFEKYSEWIYCNIGYGQEFFEILWTNFILFFCVMKCVHAKLMIIFIYLFFFYSGEELVLSFEVHIPDVREGKAAWTETLLHTKNIFFFKSVRQRKKFLKEREKESETINLCLHRFHCKLSYACLVC